MASVVRTSKQNRWIIDNYKAKMSYERNARMIIDLREQIKKYMDENIVSLCESHCRNCFYNDYCSAHVALYCDKIIDAAVMNAKTFEIPKKRDNGGKE